MLSSKPHNIKYANSQIDLGQNQINNGRFSSKYEDMRERSNGRKFKNKE